MCSTNLEFNGQLGSGAQPWGNWQEIHVHQGGHPSTIDLLLCTVPTPLEALHGQREYSSLEIANAGSRQSPTSGMYHIDRSLILVMTDQPVLDIL